MLSVVGLKHDGVGNMVLWLYGLDMRESMASLMALWCHGTVVLHVVLELMVLSLSLSLSLVLSLCAGMALWPQVL